MSEKSTIFQMLAMGVAQQAESEGAITESADSKPDTTIVHGSDAGTGALSNVKTNSSGAVEKASANSSPGKVTAAGGAPGKLQVGSPSNAPTVEGGSEGVVATKGFVKESLDSIQAIEQETVTPVIEQETITSSQLVRVTEKLVEMKAPTEILDALVAGDYDTIAEFLSTDKRLTEAEMVKTAVKLTSMHAPKEVLEALTAHDYDTVAAFLTQDPEEVDEALAKHFRGKIRRITRFHSPNSTKFKTEGGRKLLTVHHQRLPPTGSRLLSLRKGAKMHLQRPNVRVKAATAMANRRAVNMSSEEERLTPEQMILAENELKSMKAPTRVLEALQDHDYDRVAAFIISVAD